jgi:MFS family permease
MHPRQAATRMLVGIGITDLTFRTSQVALPLVVLASTGSAAATGLVGGAAGLPTLLSPWWTRGLRHRVRSGRSVAACYLAEALALSLVAAGAAVGQVSPLLLAGAGLLLGCAEAVDGPARDALIADLGDQVGEDRALALLTTRDFFRRVSMVVGPALGGLAVAHGLAVTLLWAEVLSILVSAGLTVGVAAADVPSGSTEVRGIWQTVSRRPDVLAGWVVRGTGCALWFGFTLGLAVLGAANGRGGAFLATGMTAYGVGSALGTLAILRLLGRLPVLMSIAAAWGLTGGCWAVMGRFPDERVIAAASFVSGLAVVVGNTGVTAQITRASVGAERRTLMAGQSVVVNAASSLGLLVGGPVLAIWGPAVTLQTTGVVVAVVAGGCLAAVPWLSGEALGHLRRPGAVPPTEEAGVDEQRVQLVESDAVGPAVGER